MDNPTAPPLAAAATCLPAALEPEAPAPPVVRTREIAALGALVVLADRFVWPGPGGFGLGLLLALCPLLLLTVAPVRRVSARLVTIAGALGAVAARAAWEGSAWTALVGLGLAFWFALALRSKRSFVPELLLSAVVTAFGPVFVALARYGRGAVRLLLPSRLGRVRWAQIVVPIAIVGFFGLVFTAANPLIARWAGRLIELLGTGGSLSPERVCFWGFAAVLAAGLLAPAFREPRLSERLGPGHVVDGAALAAPTEAALVMARNVLVGVNAIYLAYNALDAVYLWGGAPPPGVELTRYAHEGAVWLTIGIGAATVVLGVLFRGAMAARRPETRLARLLAYVWAAQNLVLAAGTFRRIQMYVADGGLTVLRAFGIFGVALVAVACGLIVLKVARGRTALWLLRRQLDALAIALVLWTVLPVDAIVWSFNVSRIRAGEDRPLLHLYGQQISPEAVPALLPLLDHPDLVVARGAAARLTGLRAGLRAVPRSWTARDLSSGSARAALSGVRARLDAVAAHDTDLEQLRLRAHQVNGISPSYRYDWAF